MPIGDGVDRVPRFRLFANCVPVRGARRSTICDLQRHTLHLIPNVLFEILTEHRSKTLDELCQVYGEDARDVLTEYFRFLEERELGIWTTHPERFPDIDLSFDVPGTLDSALLDVDEHSAHDYRRIADQLDQLGCQYLHVRCFATVEQVDVDAMLEATSTSRLRAIELTIRFSPALTQDRVFDWCGRYQRLASVLVHGADRTSFVASPGLGIPVRYVTREIVGATDCGFVHPAYFAVDLRTFTEARTFNTCLNRKIAIDGRGQACNCPAMGRTFGSTAEVDLRHVVEDAAFREVWSVRKDDIEVCRDCEFRYVCTDCRAHVTDPSNPRSKPARCGYDPYTATWRPVDAVGDRGSSA
jgi:SPASM domain peptide maturase of grasp-with-spasm system